jgi:hypothetical protein
MKKEKSILVFVLTRSILLAIPLIAFCMEIFERSHTPSIGGNSGMSIPDSLVFAAAFFLLEIILGINVLILLIKGNYKFAGTGFLVGLVFIGLYFLAIYVNTLV